MEDTRRYKGIYDTELYNMAAGYSPSGQDLAELRTLVYEYGRSVKPYDERGRRLFRGMTVLLRNAELYEQFGNALNYNQDMITY